jgi:hypothetical protein
MVSARLNPASLWIAPVVGSEGKRRQRGTAVAVKALTQPIWCDDYGHPIFDLIGRQRAGAANLMAEPALATGKGRLPVITVDAKIMVTAASAR